VTSWLAVNPGLLGFRELTYVSLMRLEVLQEW